MKELAPTNNLYREGGLASVNPFAKSLFPTPEPLQAAPTKDIYDSWTPEQQSEWDRYEEFGKPGKPGLLEPPIYHPSRKDDQDPGWLGPPTPIYDYRRKDDQDPGWLGPPTPIYDYRRKDEQDPRAMFPEYDGPITLADEGHQGRAGMMFTKEFTKHLQQKGYDLDMNPTHMDLSPIIIKKEHSTHATPDVMPRPLVPDVMPPVMLPLPGQENPYPVGPIRPEVMPIPRIPEVTPRPGPQPFLGTLLPTGQQQSGLTYSDDEKIRPPSIQVSRKHGGSLTQTVLNVLRNLS